MNTLRFKKKMKWENVHGDFDGGETDSWPISEKPSVSFLTMPMIFPIILTVTMIL